MGRLIIIRNLFVHASVRVIEALVHVITSAQGTLPVVSFHLSFYALNHTVVHVSRWNEASSPHSLQDEVGLIKLRVCVIIFQLKSKNISDSYCRLDDFFLGGFSINEASTELESLFWVLVENLLEPSTGENSRGPRRIAAANAAVPVSRQ